MMETKEEETEDTPAHTAPQETEGEEGGERLDGVMTQESPQTEGSGISSSIANFSFNQISSDKDDDDDDDDSDNNDEEEGEKGPECHLERSKSPLEVNRERRRKLTMERISRSSVSLAKHFAVMEKHLEVVVRLRVQLLEEVEDSMENNFSEERHMALNDHSIRNEELMKEVELHDRSVFKVLDNSMKKMARIGLEMLSWRRMEDSPVEKAIDVPVMVYSVSELQEQADAWEESVTTIQDILHYCKGIHSSDKDGLAKVLDNGKSLAVNLAGLCDAQISRLREFDESKEVFLEKQEEYTKNLRTTELEVEKQAQQEKEQQNTLSLMQGKLMEATNSRKDLQAKVKSMEKQIKAQEKKRQKELQAKVGGPQGKDKLQEKADSTSSSLSESEDDETLEEYKETVNILCSVFNRLQSLIEALEGMAKPGISASRASSSSAQGEASPTTTSVEESVPRPKSSGTPGSSLLQPPTTSPTATPWTPESSRAAPQKRTSSASRTSESRDEPEPFTVPATTSATGASTPASSHVASSVSSSPSLTPMFTKLSVPHRSRRSTVTPSHSSGTSDHSVTAKGSSERRLHSLHTVEERRPPQESEREKKRALSILGNIYREQHEKEALSKAAALQKAKRTSLLQAPRRSIHSKSRSDVLNMVPSGTRQSIRDQIVTAERKYSGVRLNTEIPQLVGLGRRLQKQRASASASDEARGKHRSVKFSTPDEHEETQPAASSSEDHSQTDTSQNAIPKRKRRQRGTARLLDSDSSSKSGSSSSQGSSQQASTLAWLFPNDFEEEEEEQAPTAGTAAPASTEEEGGGGSDTAEGEGSGFHLKAQRNIIEEESEFGLPDSSSRSSSGELPAVLAVQPGSEEWNEVVLWLKQATEAGTKGFVELRDSTAAELLTLNLRDHALAVRSLGIRGIELKDLEKHPDILITTDQELSKNVRDLEYVLSNAFREIKKELHRKPAEAEEFSKIRKMNPDMLPTGLEEWNLANAKMKIKEQEYSQMVSSYCSLWTSYNRVRSELHIFEPEKKKSLSDYQEEEKEEGEKKKEEEPPPTIFDAMPRVLSYASPVMHQPLKKDLPKFWKEELEVVRDAVKDGALPNQDFLEQVYLCLKMAALLQLKCDTLGNSYPELRIKQALGYRIQNILKEVGESRAKLRELQQQAGIPEYTKMLAGMDRIEQSLRIEHEQSDLILSMSKAHMNIRNKLKSEMELYCDMDTIEEGEEPTPTSSPSWSGNLEKIVEEDDEEEEEQEKDVEEKKEIATDEISARKDDSGSETGPERESELKEEKEGIPQQAQMHIEITEIKKEVKQEKEDIPKHIEIPREVTSTETHKAEASTSSDFLGDAPEIYLSRVASSVTDVSVASATSSNMFIDWSELPKYLKAEQSSGSMDTIHSLGSIIKSEDSAPASPCVIQPQFGRHSISLIPPHMSVKRKAVSSDQSQVSMRKRSSVFESERRLSRPRMSVRKRSSVDECQRKKSVMKKVSLLPFFSGTGTYEVLCEDTSSTPSLPNLGIDSVVHSFPRVQDMKGCLKTQQMNTRLKEEERRRRHRKHGVEFLPPIFVSPMTPSNLPFKRPTQDTGTMNPASKKSGRQVLDSEFLEFTCEGLPYHPQDSRHQIPLTSPTFSGGAELNPPPEEVIQRDVLPPLTQSNTSYATSGVMSTEYCGGAPTRQESTASQMPEELRAVASAASRVWFDDSAYEPTARTCSGKKTPVEGDVEEHPRHPVPKPRDEKSPKSRTSRQAGGVSKVVVLESFTTHHLPEAPSVAVDHVKEWVHNNEQHPPPKTRRLPAFYHNPVRQRMRQNMFVKLQMKKQKMLTTEKPSTTDPEQIHLAADEQTAVPVLHDSRLLCLDVDQSRRKAARIIRLVNEQNMEPLRTDTTCQHIWNKFDTVSDRMP